MKIVFFHSSMQAGGAERQISLLANYLAQNGRETFIVTMDNKNSFYMLDAKIMHVKLNICADSSNIFSKLFNNFKRINATRRALKQINPDVVICFGSNTIYLVKKARKNLKYKIIGSERTNPYFYQNGFWNKNKKKFADYCDGFLFQTEGAKGYYSQRIQDKSITLGNAIVKEYFEKFDIAFADRKNICAVGRFDKDKCFDEMIKAFAIAAEKYPNLILDIYGDGVERQSLEKLIVDSKLNEKVILHGKTSNIQEKYAEHKYFLMASRCEGFPNVLLEAMACGCACISTDCDFGPSDLIIDGQNGFLVETHDIEALSEKLVHLIENDGIAVNFSLSAKQVREEYDICGIGKRFSKYIDLISGGEKC